MPELQYSNPPCDIICPNCNQGYDIKWDGYDGPYNGDSFHDCLNCEFQFILNTDIQVIYTIRKDNENE